MEKVKIVINVSEGIVISVYSNQEADVVVADWDSIRVGEWGLDIQEADIVSPKLHTLYNEEIWAEKKVREFLKQSGF